MDFSVAFHPVHMLDFANMFPTKAATAQHRKCLAKKSGLNV
jgi:hypothetical protein